jgi:hypothetical protein
MEFDENNPSFWSCEQVFLWILGVRNGEFAKYADNFRSKVGRSSTLLFCLSFDSDHHHHHHHHHYRSTPFLLARMSTARRSSR